MLDSLVLKKFTNQLISKITHNLNNFSYNVIIANMHETYNFLYKHLETELNSDDLSECYKKILIIFSPVLPHLINECLSEMNYDKNNSGYESEVRSTALRALPAAIWLTVGRRR